MKYWIYELGYHLGLVSRERFLDQTLWVCDQMMWRYHRIKRAKGPGWRPSIRLVITVIASVFVSAKTLGLL